MEILGPVIELIKFVLAPVCECLSYHRGLDQYMINLKEKLEELSCRKEDLESRMREELPLGKSTKKEVELWLRNVEKINGEIQAIEQEVRKEKYLARARLGKLVAEKIQEVEKLYQKGYFSDTLVVDLPPSNGLLFPTKILAGETTAQKTMDKIWAYLMHDEVTGIGVYGMGGSGKTTIMKHINNRLLGEEVMFDVIWVTVSKEFNVVGLQNDIACALNEDLSKQGDKTKRAAMLSKMLSRKGRYVLILDDVWEPFSLEDVGIPEPSIGNEGKLVLTTRSSDVCRIMGCREVKVELLSDEEAWNLFIDKVGHDVLGFPTLTEIVKLVAKKCAGLPLAIVTVASSMKGVSNVHEWRNALNELCNMSKSVTGVENEVFEQLKFSYNRLRDPKVQQCFLYCALYPLDFEIPKEKLISCWISEGLLDEMDSMQAEYDRGHAIFNKLENNCLLERVGKGGKVKMHNLVREMALHITRETPRFMVKSGVKLREIPKEQEWAANLDKVSLLSNFISEIPSNVSPYCPILSTLLLQRNSHLRKISDSFFVHMHGLKVLDLSNTPIVELPNSVSNLENLTALVLRKCNLLSHVPSLAKLRALRKLDLSFSFIKQLPQGMENLVNLRFLDLYGVHLDLFPARILPELSRLQYLVVNFESGVYLSKRKNSKIDTLEGEELSRLRMLESLWWRFADLHEFNIYVRYLNLEDVAPNKYLLQVGGGDSNPDSYLRFKFAAAPSNPFSKEVYIGECNICAEDHPPLVLPQDVELLEISKCHDLRSLSDISSLKSASNLKSCRIVDCDGIEFSLSSSRAILQSLVSLELGGLKNLSALIGNEDVEPSTGVLFHLQRFRIYDCPGIKKLFSPYLLKNLQKLEEITVSNCVQMEEIIPMAKDEDKETMGERNKNINHSIISFALPKLRDFSLSDLPELKSICRETLVCDSIKTITVLNSPKLKRIPLALPLCNGQPSHPPALQEILASGEWWEALEWDDHNAKNVLQPFHQFVYH